MFIKELKNFSRENWWIYVLLFIALYVVYTTGKGNLIEIIILFLLNVIGNLFVMAAMGNYQEKKNKIGSIYHLSCTLTFLMISLYGAIFLSQFQYILFQITYLFAALKAITYYNFNKDIKILNSLTVGISNIIIMIIFLLLFPFQAYSFIQGLGFGLVTTGLVSTRDTFRYFMSFGGVLFITFGSLVGLYQSYMLSAIDGISLGYFLLTATVLVYHIKLLKNYLPKKNINKTDLTSL